MWINAKVFIEHSVCRGKRTLSIAYTIKIVIFNKLKKNQRSIKKILHYIWMAIKRFWIVIPKVSHYLKKGWSVMGPHILEITRFYQKLEKDLSEKFINAKINLINKFTLLRKFLKKLIKESKKLNHWLLLIIWMEVNI